MLYFKSTAMLKLDWVVAEIKTPLGGGVVGLTSWSLAWVVSRRGV